MSALPWASRSCAILALSVPGVHLYSKLKYLKIKLEPLKSIAYVHKTSSAVDWVLKRLNCASPPSASSRFKLNQRAGSTRPYSVQTI